MGNQNRSREGIWPSRSLRSATTTMAGWPRGEAAACKAVDTGSNPVPASQVRADGRHACVTLDGSAWLAALVGELIDQQGQGRQRRPDGGAVRCGQLAERVSEALLMG